MSDNKYNWQSHMTHYSQQFNQFLIIRFHKMQDNFCIQFNESSTDESDETQLYFPCVEDVSTQLPSSLNPLLQILDEDADQEFNNPFMNAKQVYLDDLSFFWTRSLYISRPRQDQLEYISTAYSYSKEGKFKIITYLNYERVVVFNIVMEDEKSQQSCWSLLSIYHRQNIFDELYSLMRGLRYIEIVAFWLIRSYAIQVKLFRLQVVKHIPEKGFLYRKTRLWDCCDIQDIYQTVNKIIESFSAAKSIVSYVPVSDKRLSTHNKIQWSNPMEKDWTMLSEEHFTKSEQFMWEVQPSDCQKWDSIIQYFYSSCLNSYRVSIQSEIKEGNMDKVMIGKDYGAYFRQGGKVINVEDILSTKVKKQYENNSPFIYFKLQDQSLYIDSQQYGEVQERSQQQKSLDLYSSLY